MLFGRENWILDSGRVDPYAHVTLFTIIPSGVRMCLRWSCLKEAQHPHTPELETRAHEFIIGKSWFCPFSLFKLPFIYTCSLLLVFIYAGVILLLRFIPAPRPETKNYNTAISFNSIYVHTI